MGIIPELFGEKIDLGDLGHMDALLTGAVESISSDEEFLGRVLLEHGFTGTDRLGRKWVDGKEVAGTHADGGGEKTGASAHTSAVPHEDATAIRQGVESSLPPEVAKKPGLAAKIGDIALTVAAHVYTKMVQWTPAAMRVAAALDVVVDTPGDILKKFGFNPGPGQDNASIGHNDFVKQNLTDAFGYGVSGHVAARVAAEVLSRALLYAKSKVTGSKHESEADGVAEVAGTIAELLAMVSKEFGLSGAPDPTNVAKAIGEMLKGR